MPVRWQIPLIPALIASLGLLPSPSQAESWVIQVTETEEWIEESEGGCKKFDQIREEESKHSIEEVGERLRGLMPWIKKRDIKGSQASYS